MPAVRSENAIPTPDPLLSVVALALGGITILITALSLSRSKVWWVRVCDFPRLQAVTLGAAALALWIAAGHWLTWPGALFTATLAAATAFQLMRIWRYTPLAPREVQNSALADGEGRLSLIVSNVLQTNREAERLLGAVRDADADVALFVETNEWWRDRLDALAGSHPHAVRCALPNTYGMLLYSRLPLEDTQVDYLVQPDIPSIQAKVRLRNGELVWINCVHPRPPAPSESDKSLERDTELLVIGKRVCDSGVPVIVCGDLNDVAWSRTTRLFQKVSRLVDPRKGRGFYSTFHARYPGLRYPLDHIFHSDSFRLVSLRRLPYVGSDHFPMFTELSYEPRAAAEQEGPEKNATDVHEANRTIARGNGSD